MIADIESYSTECDLSNWGFIKFMMLHPALLILLFNIFSILIQRLLKLIYLRQNLYY